MDNKILFIGSILFVLILIFASFNSVVGYQSNIISSVKNSPLFDIRTGRALKDKNIDVTTGDYIGKDKGETIPFPTRDSKAVLIRKIIDKVRGMDKEALNNLKTNLIQQFRTEKENLNCNLLDINEIVNLSNDDPTSKGILCTIFEFYILFCLLVLYIIVPPLAAIGLIIILAKNAITLLLDCFIITFACADW